MPVYLLHGFRWPRQAIRIHIILQNLDDAAAEWLIAPKTTACLHDNFRTLYPEIMAALPNLRFIEQYDPLDLVTKSHPYAYVADVVHEIKLSADIDDIRGQGLKNEQWAALIDLRDALCKEQKVAWYMVVCGDEERYAPTPPEQMVAEKCPNPALVAEMYANEKAKMFGANGLSMGAANGTSRGNSSFASGARASSSTERPATPSRFRTWFGGMNSLRKSKSSKSLRTQSHGKVSSIVDSSDYNEKGIPTVPTVPSTKMNGTAKRA